MCDVYSKGFSCYRNRRSASRPKPYPTIKKTGLFFMYFIFPEFWVFHGHPPFINVRFSDTVLAHSIYCQFCINCTKAVFFPWCATWSKGPWGMSQSELLFVVLFLFFFSFKVIFRSYLRPWCSFFNKGLFLLYFLRVPHFFSCVDVFFSPRIFSQAEARASWASPLVALPLFAAAVFGYLMGSRAPVLAPRSCLVGLISQKNTQTLFI